MRNPLLPRKVWIVVSDSFTAGVSGGGDNGCGRTASTDGDDGCVTVKATGGGGGAWSVTSYSGEQIPSIQPSWSPGNSSFLFRSKMAWKHTHTHTHTHTSKSENAFTPTETCDRQTHTPTPCCFFGGVLKTSPQLARVYLTSIFYSPSFSGSLNLRGSTEAVLQR